MLLFILIFSWFSFLPFLFIFIHVFPFSSWPLCFVFLILLTLPFPSLLHSSSYHHYFILFTVFIFSFFIFFCLSSSSSSSSSFTSSSGADVPNPGTRHVLRNVGSDTLIYKLWLGSRVLSIVSLLYRVCSSWHIHRKRLYLTGFQRRVTRYQTRESREVCAFG